MTDRRRTDGTRSQRTAPRNHGSRLETWRKELKKQKERKSEAIMIIIANPNYLKRKQGNKQYVKVYCEPASTVSSPRPASSPGCHEVSTCNATQHNITPQIQLKIEFS
jgi:hypothetical protein